jgi:hypothetical protein
VTGIVIVKAIGRILSQKVATGSIIAVITSIARFNAHIAAFVATTSIIKAIYRILPQIAATVIVRIPLTVAGQARHIIVVAAA